MTEWTTIANPDSDDVAVLLPGTGYTAQAPLLYWAGRLLAERGWQVRAISWTVPDDVDPVAFAETAAASAFEGTTGRRLVVAKSFGCFAMPWADAAGVPGIWLTPVATHEAVAQAASRLRSRDLLIGGSDDPLWDAAAVAGSAAEVIEIAEADHGLLHSDGWRLSLDVHRRVLDAISRHLDEVVDPV